MPRPQIIDTNWSRFAINVYHPIELVSGSPINTADGLDHTAIRGANSSEVVAGMLLSGLLQDVMSVCSIDYCYAHGRRGALSVGVFAHIELQFNTNFYHL